jgi:hypothetical protein
LLALDVKEFIESDRAWRSNVAAGLYSTPILQAVTEWESIRAGQAELVAEKALNDELLTRHFPDGKTAPGMYGMIYAAWASGLIDTGTFREYPYTYSGYPDVPSANRAVHLMLGTQAYGYHVFDIERARLASAKNNAERRAGVVSNRVSVESDTVEWIVQTSKAEKSAHESSVEITKLKMRAAMEPRGSLNYSEQAKQARVLYEDQMTEGLGRLGLSATGLHAIFEYPNPLPKDLTTSLHQHIATMLTAVAPNLYNLATPDIAQTRKLDPLGLARSWLADAIGWLAAQRHRERRYTVAISLRPIITSGDMLATGASFLVNHDILMTKKRVRILGLAVEVDDAPGNPGYWRAEVIPPVSGDYRVPGGGAGFNQMEQKNCEARLGRIQPARINMPPPFEGTEVVLNCSPIGLWKLQILGQSSKGASMASAGEITLHLAVAEWET